MRKSRTAGNKQHTHPLHSYFSYFTDLSYIGLLAYFCAASVQTIAFELRGHKNYPLQKWPRFLQLLHVLLYTTVIVFRASSPCFFVSCSCDTIQPSS